MPNKNDPFAVQLSYSIKSYFQWLNSVLHFRDWMSQMLQANTARLQTSTPLDRHILLNNSHFYQ